MKKLLVVILALAALLASCGVNRGTPVMTLHGAEVTDHMFEYWVDSYKAVLLSTYTDAKNTPEFWDTKIASGVTAEDFFYDLTYNYIESNLVAMYLFDKYGLEIEDEDEATASSIISELEEAYADGNRNAFNRLLANYGVNADLLKEIYLEELKSTYVYNYVFENAVLTVGDEEKEEFLKDNYVRIRQIYVNNKYDFEASSYDEAGNFTMAPLDDAVKAEKDQKAEDAKALVASGKDFDEVYKEYSEETSYPNGYYLSVTTQDLPQELISKALSLEVGEVAVFESDYGTHIIKRLEMDSHPWEDDANKDFFGDFTTSVYEAVYTDFVSSFYDEITVDRETIAKYTVRDALPNYSFQY